LLYADRNSKLVVPKGKWRAVTSQKNTNLTPSLRKHKLLEMWTSGWKFCLSDADFAGRQSVLTLHWPCDHWHAFLWLLWQQCWNNASVVKKYGSDRQDFFPFLNFALSKQDYHASLSLHYKGFL
jgi:hypothetical protein